MALVKCRKCEQMFPRSRFAMNQTRGGNPRGKKYYYPRSECIGCGKLARQRRDRAKKSAGLHTRKRVPDGICECCGADGKRVVDHCHDVDGSVRGLVCSVPCNSQLLGGCTQERRGLLVKAIDYLDRYQAKQGAKLASRREAAAAAGGGAAD